MGSVAGGAKPALTGGSSGMPPGAGMPDGGGIGSPAGGGGADDGSAGIPLGGFDWS